MPETKPISTFAFQISLISLDRFVICDTSWIKSGNAYLIFSSHAFWILADQERVCIQAFETSKITERIFSETNIVVRRPSNLREMCFGTSFLQRIL